MTIREIFGLEAVRPFTNIATKYENAYPVKSEELIGIEVEVENHNLQKRPEKVWSLTQDGSLRNGGAEWISQPIPANRASDALFNLTSCLHHLYCFSPRTSVHVHLNAQDLTSEQVGDLVAIYLIFEHAFFRYVGRRRINNPYCVPISHTHLLMNYVQNGVKARWEKYAALNMLPLRDKGTLEFRHMHGTLDNIKLSKWVAMITSLKEYVKKNSTSDIRKRIFGLTVEGIPEMIASVFPSCPECIKFNSLEDFKYPLLSAKYFISSAKTIQLYQKQVSKESLYFKIKD